MKEAKYLFKDWWLQKIVKEEYTQQAIDDGTQLEIAKMDLIRQFICKIMKIMEI